MVLVQTLSLSDNQRHEPPSRSFIFCTSFMYERMRNCSSSRWERWAQYYSERKELFGAERIFLIDDGTRHENIPVGMAIVSADHPLPEELPDGPVMFRFAERYGRYSLVDFPGWWRSFTFSSKIANKYSFSKIIHCESDAYVMSRRMAAYIKHLRTGWTAFWCPKYDFPETALQVICHDSINMLERFYERGEVFWRSPGHLAEQILPFTNINKGFVGDRYGENLTDYPEDSDYVCQSKESMRVDERLKSL